MMDTPYQPRTYRADSGAEDLVSWRIVIAETDLVRAVGLLHQEFFATLDPNVFERKEAVHA